MTIIDKQASRIEANERSIEANDRRLIEIHEQQQQRRREVAAAKEKLVLDIVRDARLLDQPPREIVRVLASLKVTHAGPSPAATLLPAQDYIESKGDVNDGGDLYGVAVKISRNASAAKREVLETAGLRWNGRREAWIGKTMSATIEQLRSTFGDRVTSHPLAPIAATSEGGSGAPEPLSGGADALGDAAAGDVSVPAPGVPDGVVGQATAATTGVAKPTGG